MLTFGILIALIVIQFIAICFQSLTIQELKINNQYYVNRLDVVYRQVPEIGNIYEPLADQISDPVLPVWDEEFVPAPYEQCPKANSADPDGPYASTIYPALTKEETIDSLRAAIVQLENQIAHLQEDNSNV